MRLTLRYSADLRSLSFIGISLLVLYSPFALAIPIWLVPLWCLLSTFLSFSCCAIAHNHGHLPIFVSPKANRVLDVLLTFTRGTTATSILVPHNLNHHRHYCEADDWIRPEHMGKRGPLGLVRYTFRSCREMARARRLPGAPRLSQPLQHWQRVQQVLLITVLLGCMTSGFLKTILFLFLPWTLASLFLVTVNLPQHDECLRERPLMHSRNFVGRWGNWVLFNNGYHAAHHENPTLHWSLLPEWHRKHVSQKIPRDLEQRSLCRYLIIRYLLGRPKYEPSFG